jgi:hypothetical protein
VVDDGSLYNNILTPTKLSVGSNYHLFKEGIRPMWEDPVNAKGGKWIFTNARSRKARLDECWLHVMLSLIGESLHDEDDICGAVVSVRKPQDRIAIWTGNANKEDLQKAVGRSFRSCLSDFGKNEVLKFQSHAAAAASGSSFQNEVCVCLGATGGNDLQTNSICLVWLQHVRSVRNSGLLHSFRSRWTVFYLQLVELHLVFFHCITSI